MYCYLCDDQGYEEHAVAVCHSCGIGLCRHHLDQDLLAARVQGVVRRQCTHYLIQRARQRQHSRVEVELVAS